MLKTWEFQPSGKDKAVLKKCPLCGDERGKFYINVGAGEEDGLWHCFICNQGQGRSGNLWQLKEALGDNKPEAVMSVQGWAGNGQQPGPLPDVNACHRRLMDDGEALDYLVAERGLSMAVIEKFKLGSEEFGGKKWVVIPYYNRAGNLIYAKFRTIPPAKKEFRNVSGREQPLFNDAVITSGMDEIIFTEGEIDALTLASYGYENVCGIPGANNKKAEWIDKLDNAQPKEIFLLYDRDKVGQEAAREMASRIGIEKARNILLPEFTTADGKPGKDINEWFKAGHTREEFETLKAQAKPFDVKGVMNAPAALDEVERELNGMESLKPKYDTPWAALNRKLGGAEPGDVIDIIAQAKIGKTTLALNWADYIVDKYQDPALVFCLEMTAARLARKWASYVTKTDDSPAKDPEEAVRKLAEMKAAVAKAKEIARTRPADLLFAFTRVQTPDDVYDTIRQAVRRYGVKFVVFDNLQLLADMTLRSQHNRTVHLSQISKKLKALAVELGIVIIRIVQPNRVRDGEIVDAHNADGASQIEKDCDAMVCLHRKRKAHIRENDFDGFMDEEISFEPQMLVRVDLSRYAPGGVCTLLMEGNISTVREITPEDLASLKKAIPPTTAISNETVEV